MISRFFFSKKLQYKNYDFPLWSMAITLYSKFVKLLQPVNFTNFMNLIFGGFFCYLAQTPGYIATAKVYTMPPWWPELMRVRKFFPDKIAVCSYLLLSVTTNMDQMAKTRQKLDSKIREIDWSYLCLEQFDKFWICSARHDRKRKLFELVEFVRKRLLKPLLLHLFSAYFSLLEPSTNS